MDKNTIEICAEIKEINKYTILILDEGKEIRLPRSHVTYSRSIDPKIFHIYLPEWLAKKSGILPETYP